MFLEIGRIRRSQLCEEVGGDRENSRYKCLEVGTKFR